MFIIEIKRYEKVSESVMEIVLTFLYGWPGSLVPCG
jgi:hypothetical protein